MDPDNTETRQIDKEMFSDETVESLSRLVGSDEASGEVAHLPPLPPDRNFCYLTAAVLGAGALFCAAIAVLLWALSKG